MNKSQSVENLAKSLTAFQSEIKSVLKTADNPFFHSKYADLASIIEAVRKPLAKNGLSFSQFPDGDSLTTILLHTSGEWIEASYALNAVGKKPQEVGSAITYARRYALGAVLGIATDEDDDGNAASGNTVAKVQPKNAEIDRQLGFIKDQENPSILAEWRTKISEGKYAEADKKALLSAIDAKLKK
jgi:hypothetical protein